MYFHPNEYHAMPCTPGNEIHFGIMFKWHKKAKQQFKNPSRTASSEQVEVKRNETGPLVFVPDFTIRALKHQSVEFFCYNVEYDLVVFSAWISTSVSPSYLTQPSLLSIIRHHHAHSHSHSHSAFIMAVPTFFFFPFKFSLIFLRLLKPKPKE